MTDGVGRCPSCGSERTVPIVYSLPSADVERRAQEGEVVLGGCIVEDDQPDRACLDCRAEWRVADEPVVPSDG